MGVGGQQQLEDHRYCTAALNQEECVDSSPTSMAQLMQWLHNNFSYLSPEVWNILSYTCLCFANFPLLTSRLERKGVVFVVVLKKDAYITI